MFTDILEVLGPIVLKTLSGVACIVVFAPLLAAFVGPVFS